MMKLNGHYYLKSTEALNACTDAKAVFYAYKDQNCPLPPVRGIKHLDSDHMTYVLSVFEDTYRLLERLYDTTTDDHIKLDLLVEELKPCIYEKHNITDYDEYVLSKNQGTFIGDSSYRRFLYNVGVERSIDFLRGTTP